MKPFTTIAGILFLAGGAIHGYRLYSHFPVVIDNYAIPLWFSGAGVVAALFLALMLFREAGR